MPRSVDDCIGIVLRLYLEGKSINEIARVCGGYRPVYEALRRAGVPIGRVRPISRDEEELILELARRGYSIYEIARAVGRSYSTIYRLLKRKGLI